MWCHLRVPFPCLATPSLARDRDWGPQPEPASLQVLRGGSVYFWVFEGWDRGMAEGLCLEGAESCSQDRCPRGRSFFCPAHPSLGTGLAPDRLYIKKPVGVAWAAGDSRPGAMPIAGKAAAETSVSKALPDPCPSPSCPPAKAMLFFAFTGTLARGKAGREGVEPHRLQG